MFRNQCAKFIFRNSQWLVRSLQRIFGNDFILALTYQQTYRIRIGRVFHQLIHRSYIKTELSQICWIKISGFEFDNDKTPEFKVIEKQISEEFLLPYFQPYLPSHIRKTVSKFKKKASDVFDQSIFKFTFVIPVSHSQKIECIRIFQYLLGKITHRRWQFLLKIC